MNTKIMIDWLGLRVAEMSNSQRIDIYNKVRDDCAGFTKKWVFRKLEAELGFSPEKTFDLWAQPHLYQVDLMSFIIEFANKGLAEVDWVEVGHRFMVLLVKNRQD